MKNVELLQKAIDVARLTREEAAEIMNITRNTLYRWLTGKPVRYRLSEQFAVFQAKKIIKAVELGLLPLPPGYVDKVHEINNIIKGIKA